jgi:AraC family transcriptional regulator of adaptative response/methylated-DNA-[protein]-cysteine methyltransferase
MIAVGDEQALCLLEFVISHDKEREIKRVSEKTKSSIIYARNKVIESIEKEIALYFQGSFQEFQTPIKMMGSSFQEKVWLELQKIPLGETASYLDIAKAIKNPGASRAVGSANRVNAFTILVPCHRVILSNGALGGYAGGVARKQWLLEHEKKHAKV